MWGRALYIFFEVIVKVVIPQISVGLLKAVQVLVDVFTVILVGTNLCRKHLPLNHFSVVLDLSLFKLLTEHCSIEIHGHLLPLREAPDVLVPVNLATILSENWLDPPLFVDHLWINLVLKCVVIKQHVTHFFAVFDLALSGWVFH